MQRLIEQLKRHEGVKTHAYKDHLGYVTVGVGRCLEEGIGVGLSEDEIEYLLLNDIKRCNNELQKAFDWFSELDEVRRDAMINLCFNVGLPRLRGFVKALAAMEAKDYEEAAKEFFDSRWATQVGNRAVEVCAMIRTGEYE